MPNPTRYLVVDIPTAGPHKGLITKLWDCDLQFTDAHLLRKKIANRRLSKWPVVLDENDPVTAKLEVRKPIDLPTPEQCAMLLIDRMKLVEISKSPTLAGSESPGHGSPPADAPLPGAGGNPIQPSWSDEERITAVSEAAKKAAAEANARAERATADVERAKFDLVVYRDGDPIDGDPIEIKISPGYMGDPTKWCFIESEYPEDGTSGPYDSEELVRAAIAQNYKAAKITVVPPPSAPITP